MLTKRIYGAAVLLLALTMLSSCGESAESSVKETTTAELTTTTVSQTTTTQQTTTTLTETTTTTEATLPPISEEDVSAQVQKSYRTGYDQGYADGLAEGVKQQTAPQDVQKQKVRVSGDFTATVRRLCPDYITDDQNRVAVVTLFQDGPFVLRLTPELCAQLKEGETYTFVIDAQEAELCPEQLWDDHIAADDALKLGSFSVSSVREPEEDEYGLECWRVHYTT